MCRKLLAIVLSLCCMASFVYADTVYLKDGKIYNKTIKPAEKREKRLTAGWWMMTSAFIVSGYFLGQESSNQTKQASDSLEAFNYNMGKAQYWSAISGQYMEDYFLTGSAGYWMSGNDSAILSNQYTQSARDNFNAARGFENRAGQYQVLSVACYGAGLICLISAIIQSSKSSTVTINFNPFSNTMYLTKKF